jgi:hypothetical protein
MALSRFRPIIGAIAICFFVSFAVASVGDQDLRYRDCKKNCLKATSEQDFDLTLRLFLWDKENNCIYLCSRENYHQRVANGEKIVQYHGKWPFLRVLFFMFDT